VISDFIGNGNCYYSDQFLVQIFKYSKVVHVKILVESS